MEIRQINAKEKDIIKQVVQIHLNSFEGFFLTFMGRGFLTHLYKSYCQYRETGLLVAFEDEKPIGFLAYSGDYSGLYKFMIRKKLIPFAWYSAGAFLRKPKTFMRLIRAFSKSDSVKRDEKYIELASIGVDVSHKAKGVGTSLIKKLKKMFNKDVYSYIALETDADNNEIANNFYSKNGFQIAKTFVTAEGRRMNEYRFIL